MVFLVIIILWVISIKFKEIFSTFQKESFLTIVNRLKLLSIVAKISLLMFAEVLATPLSFAYRDVSLFLMIKGEPVLPVSFIKWYLVFARLGFV